MSLEDLLRDREFMAKVLWIGYIGSLVLIGIGLFVILRNLFG